MSFWKKLDIRLPDGIRAEISAELVRILLPSVALGILLSWAGVYFGAYGQWHRMYPGLFVLPALIPIWWWYRNHRPILAANMLVVLFNLATLLGLVVSGGPRAPIYWGTLGFVVIMALLYGTRIATIYALLALIVGWIAAVAISQGWIARTPEPTMAYTIFHIAVWLSLTLVFITIPLRLLVRVVSENKEARKAAEIALRREQNSELAFRILFDQSFQLMFLLDRQGRIEQMNRTALELTGVTSTSSIGMRCREIPFWDPDSTEMVCRMIRDALDGQTCRMDVRIRTAAGSARDLDLSASPYRNAAGEVRRVVLEGRDISDRRQLEKQIHQSQKMEAIGQLAGGVAHDFNNSLAGIIGAAELIRMPDAARADIHRYADLILTAAERGGELVHKLLSFSRKTPRNNIPVDIPDIIDDTVLLLQRAIDKTIDVEVDNQSSHPRTIGDAALLQNCFMNMGINASHAMPDGGKFSIRIRNIQLEETADLLVPFQLNAGEYLNIDIEDTGCGMDPETLERVFDPFFTTKEKDKGTGLGLTTVFRTIREHHGAITVASTPNVGTTFRIYLPVTHRTAPETPRTDTPSHQTDATVLLIDDDPTIRNTMTLILEEEGFQILTADNGKTGLERFRQEQHRIDAIVLDMIMPIMNGREAFEEIRRICPSVPVIIASGFSREEDVVALQQRGVHCFLPKPFRASDLLTALHSALHPRHSRGN